jgi:hypothetical protein
MAEGPLDMITQLKAKIEAYTGEIEARELLAASAEIASNATNHETL